MNRNRQAFFLFLLIAAGLGPRQLAAQLTPAGPETRVDTVPESRLPNCPRIGVAPDGSFEIAWDYLHSQPPEVKARHYDANGSPTDPEEILVATSVYYPAAVDLSPVSTGFRALLRVNGDPRGAPKFFRRRIDVDGVPAGTPRPVGTATTRWVSSGPGDTVFAGTSKGHRLSVQKVDALGKPTGKSYVLNSRPINPSAHGIPVIAPFPDGGWVAAFTGYSVPRPGSPARQVIRARLFNAGGTAAPDFDVNSTPLGKPESAPFLGFYDVVVASHPSGFAISWYVHDVTGPKLRVRFYDASGIAEGEEITVATNDSYIYPLSGAFDDAGRLLLLWGAGTGLNPVFRAQLFHSSGEPVGPSFNPDSAASGAFNRPSCGRVASVGDSWLITWMANTDDYQARAIFVRRFH